MRALYPECSGIKPPWREPIKKLLDDRRFKKVFDDERLLKPFRDPRKPLDFRPELPSGPVVRPGGGGPVIQPFALATPHHAALGMDEQIVAESAAFAQSLQLQLLEIDAALGQAEAQAAASAHEIARLQQLRAEVEAAYYQALQMLPGAG